MTLRAAPLPEAEPAAEWTLADLFSVLFRRRSWIPVAVAVCLSVAILWCVCATPRYRATAEIEIQKESHGGFGLDNTTSDNQSTAVSDAFDENLTLQTEIGILQSDSLALDVIRRVGLEGTPDYFAPRPSAFPWLHAWVQRVFFWRKPLEPLPVPLAGAPNRRYVALKIFAGHCTISPIAGTRLIAIRYSDPDPARAAAVVAAILQSLSDYGFQSRSTAAAQSASWLAAQLADLRKQTDALDDRAAALDRASGNLGDDDSHNVVLARLDQLNATLSAAESNRMVREAIWRAVQGGNSEAISGLAGNPAAGANTQNSFALLQSLRGQESAAEAELAESNRRYGENWPAVAEQRARLATLQKSIQDEVQRLGERARSDYEVSVQAEDAARTAFAQQRELASRLTGSAVALRLARQEAGESRELYSTLMGRLQEAGVLEGLHSGNFIVVSPPLAPPSNHPASPNPLLLSAVAVASGLCIGSAGAIVAELIDDSVHTPADLESLVDTPTFAALPAVAPAVRWYRRLLPAPYAPVENIELSAASDFALPSPHSALTEALHRLRINLLLSHSGRAPQVITFTAAGPEDFPKKLRKNPEALPDFAEEEYPGVGLGLAAVLAQHGSRVLYVDADLRSSPAVQLPEEPGLSDLLAGDHPTLSSDDTAMLSVIGPGSRPPCPAELIASPRMSGLLSQWREQFGFIVIHSSAATFVEALVLAQMSDAVLLTARAGETRRQQVVAAHQALSRQVPDHAVLGLILENVPRGGRNAQA